MKNKMKNIVIMGIVCALATAAACVYSVLYNQSRFVKPMDLSQYVWRIEDTPMIACGVLVALYALYVAVTVIKYRMKNIGTVSQTTRKINPKLGYLGFFGFLGFLGFLNIGGYSDRSAFLFFTFFGFFSFFYEGKMSGTLMDERYLENRRKARLTAGRISMSIIFVATFILGGGKFTKNAEAALAALLIIISLSMALYLFLSTYLTYHYDNDESMLEREE